MTRDVAGPTVAEEQLTSPGTALGTVANMSPERARGEEVDARTDLFSFGAVLYEMATGAPAFQGDTTGGIFEMILHGAPADPVRLNQRVPAKLAEIIAKALEKDRRLSSQFAGEMRADLARLKRETDSTRNAITVTQPADAASAVSVVVIPPSRAAPADLTTPASGMTPAAPVPAAAARRHRIPVWIAAIAVVALAAIASVWYLWPRAPKLTSKDSIVLADFTNSSGRA